MTNTNKAKLKRPLEGEMTGSEEAIAKALCEEAIKILEEENGKGWCDTHTNELAYFVAGMPHKWWLPIEAMPDAIDFSSKHSPQVLLIWWDNDFHLVLAKNGEWVLYDCDDGDCYPFQADEKPLYWCPLPFVPYDAFLNKEFPDLPKD